MMEKRSMVLLTVIALATLLVAVVGATFAYFTATSTDNRQDNEGKGGTTLHTAEVTNTTVVANVDGAAGSFTATSIYPGHMEIAGLSVEVDAGEAVNNEQGKDFQVPFIYNVKTNDITNKEKEGEGKAGAVKYYLYRSDEILEKNTAISGEEPSNKMTSKIDLGCNVQIESSTHMKESCSFKNATDTKSSNTTTANEHTLTLIATGSLKGGPEVIQMLDTINISNTNQAKKVYYYFVVEFENVEEDQSSTEEGNQAGKTLEATLSVA